jgi:hypothetical protein
MLRLVEPRVQNEQARLVGNGAVSGGAMERDEVKAAWKAARAGGTFLTRKHDPNHLQQPWQDYRTVLTHQTAAKLDEYLDGNDFDIEYFENGVTPFWWTLFGA